MSYPVGAPFFESVLDEDSGGDEVVLDVVGDVEVAAHFCLESFGEEAMNLRLTQRRRIRPRLLRQIIIMPIRSNTPRPHARSSTDPEWHRRYRNHVIFSLGRVRRVVR
mmetsp:Transcript_12909/g.15143  ORF Transcript_12909/g.15143 Transcript_12909/m.15143 type:complete len:108 (+) Transcript_12909:379-702(+)